MAANIKFLVFKEIICSNETIFNSNKEYFSCVLVQDVFKSACLGCISGVYLGHMNIYGISEFFWQTLGLSFCSCFFVKPISGRLMAQKDS